MKNSAPVLEEHQAELAHDRVEALGVEGERLGSAASPVESRGLASRNRQHALVDVEPDRRAARADARRNRPRQHTRAACDVEHAIAGTERDGIRHAISPLLE